MTGPRIVPLGDQGLTITWDAGVDTHRVARAAAARLAAAGIPEIRDLLPAYTTLAVFYDAGRADFEAMAARVRPLIQEPATPGVAPAGREIRIPVRYDGEDLALVARRTGLSAPEVIARHSGVWYEAFLVGFVPGWAYLGPLDPALALPRRDTPRQRVPAGSVAIAASQTGVYPFATPGGWHLIGRTDAVIFDPARDPPALIQTGDRVRFDPVSP